MNGGKYRKDLKFNNKVSKKMKKMIYGVVALAVAAVMTSCCGGGSQYITKGDKSVMDTLSHSVGVSVGYGTAQNMPDVRLDWDEVMKGAEKGMKVALDVKEDPKHKEVYATLEEFFMNVRQARLTEMRTAAEADSTKSFNIKDVDIFENEAERKEISYAYGYDFGFNVRSSRMPLQTYWIAEGLNAGAKAENADEIYRSAQEFIRRYYMEILPAQNVEKSAAWLAEVEKMKGVEKTESGLLYRIDRAGDESIKPTAEDKVKVDYEGKLSDGFVFDSSYERGEPIEFPLRGVIRGWTEGLQLVGKGGQITLWIPADLAYGPRGGGNIGPNEALEFKVELHDVIVAEPVVEESAEEVTEE